MTVTTTLRIDDELEARIAAAAAAAGKTSDAFILDAITRTVEQAEEASDFYRLADERWEEFQKTGLSVSWEEMNEWLEARLRGERPPPPQGRVLKR